MFALLLGDSYFPSQLNELGIIPPMAFVPTLGPKSQVSPNCVSKRAK